ncbi:cytochrome c-type biogenesis protein CcsB [Arcticibacter tournemirensis]|uniref:Cytochrome C biogenesis protein n=1 Tax=Arcticibacter tournemirensis TaxID=699437 RepID=A0A5M9H7D8_9SPHI|nr:cytochrome c biogenesis protein CcsA [Arcticibacter tournemirensis]KAA8482853.1 cytochrome C biogenesis protein [Arcticibacter tournemirensis]TQM49770.1 cytochrome c-type biogenesis protein CcsB [Arcticibacter tournemirensis]
MTYYKFLTSTRTSLVLLIAFAAAMAVATFIENDHGTAVARGLVYETWWFEFILLWLAVNFLAHIRQYKLFHRNRWPIGLFHIAFVIIIIGAGVTRYFSEEGVIHIREGQKEDTFYTNARYLQLKQIDKGSGKQFQKPVTLISHNFKPQATSANLGDETFTVIFEEYTTGAREEIVAGSDTFLEFAVASGEGRQDYVIKEGNGLQMGGLSLGTQKGSRNPVKIFKQGKTWMIHSAVHLQQMDMATQQIGVLHAGETKPLKLRSLYQAEGVAFLVKAIHEKATLKYRQEKDEKLAKNLPEVVKLKVTDEHGKPLVDSYIRMSSLDPSWQPFTYKGKQYMVTYGPKAKKLPFNLHLRDFQLERYPGSQSPESYASELRVTDSENDFRFRVFMNNVLDYKGYRFYQSSYDTDEKGTVLSVNRDRPGTYLTYLGYTLLGLGMFLTLFTKGSRFRLVNKKLTAIRKRTGAALTALLTFLCISANAQSPGTLPLVPAEKAAEYGKLIVQDLDGRMKPLNTLANEILRKLNGKSSIALPDSSGGAKLSPEQFLLAVQMDPVLSSRLPLIRIDKEKSHLAFLALGIKPAERISFSDFVNKDGEYLLQDLVEEANKLKPAERNEGHKELLKTDERFNIFYALLTGDFLRIFPNKDDPNNTWFTSQQSQKGFAEEDARFVENITALYLSGLQKGLQERNWTQADEALSYMHLFQQKAGKKVYPEERLIKAELLYNKLSLGNKLFGPFWLTGILMLALVILMLFKESKLITWGWIAGKALSWLGLLIFTFHLGLRWYIAKHPPWSDGFEMLVFVAWGVLLFGLIFSAKSKFTVPLALLFSGTLLFVSFLDWLNPEITNLMPVLHSYWLKIHVAIIVSSYAPLALTAILGLLSLLLLIFKPASPKPNWWISMQELTIVSEMSATIGLFLLTIGTFLGGVWANESWGRYWAWDPKETWALISVIVYAFVLHLRLIPALKNMLTYSLASLWAFSSIVMTSFGVNYYLSGLHSYAAGDPVPIPVWVYWAVGILLLISVISVLKYRKMQEQEKKMLIV